ncbi:hypothetical protein L4C38_17975 [Vibrio kasasachensis]|uniref:hypothetical protein n=1 Tax=Vibrio kasasachensis TaxID=2910248 RepID=UPI003D0AB6D2
MELILELHPIVNRLTVLSITVFGLTLVLYPAVLFSLRNKNNPKAKYGHGLLFAKEDLLTKKGMKLQYYIKKTLLVSGTILLVFAAIDEVFY